MTATEYAWKVETWNRREQWEKDALEVIQRLPVEGTVLDLGCGTGRFLQMVSQRRPFLSLIGVDPNPSCLVLARSKVNPQLVHWYERIEQVHVLADVVVSMHSMMQMEDPWNVFTEARHVLKGKTGRLIVLTSNVKNRTLWAVPNLLTAYEDDPTIKNRHDLNGVKVFFREIGYSCTTLRYHNLSWVTRWVPSYAQHIWYEGSRNELHGTAPEGSVAK